MTDKYGNIVGTIRDKVVSILKEYEQKIQAQIVDDHLDISIDAEEDYQITVQSDAPATIAIVQENVAYNSVNNGAVYSPSAGSTTIDIKPDTPASAAPVTGDNGKSIAPDKVWLLGDANSDGKVGVEDAVELQKWLLGIPDSEITEWTAADIYEDNKLNAFDMVLMRQLIMQ